MANEQIKITASKTLLLLLTLIFCQSFVACQNKEQKAAAAMQKCQQLLDKDEVLAAGDCYGNALIANPEKATEISKTGEDAVFNKCVELHDKKNYKQAIICFDATTALKPDSANVYFLLADSYYQYNKVSDNSTTDLLDPAEEAIEQGLKIRPDDAPAHGFYGQILDAKKEYRQATEQYRQAIKLDPKTSVYLVKLALAQEKLVEDTEAIKSYNQVLQLDSKQTIALYNSGLIYERQGKTDEAIAAYERLLQIQPEYDDAGERLKLLKDKRTIEKQSKSKTGLVGRQ